MNLCQIAKPESVNCLALEGMRAIFGRNAHVARRIIWIFILITCFSIAVLQVRVSYIAHFLIMHVPQIL